MVLFQAVRTTITMIFLLLYMSLLVKTPYSGKQLRKIVIPAGVVIGGYNLFWIVGMRMQADFILWFVTIGIPSILLFVLLMREVTGKEVFSVLIAISYCVVGGLSGRILNEVYHNPIFYLGSETVVYIALAYFLKYKFCKPYRVILDYIADGWILLCGVPCPFLATLYFLVCYPSFLARWQENILAIILTIFGMFATYLVIYELFKELQKRSIAEEDLHVLEMQVKDLKYQAERYEEQYQQIRIYRHDMRHFANIIESHLKNGYVDEAINTIDKMYGYINSSQESRYCENLPINAVLSHYVSNARNNDIEVDVKCNLPKELPVEELELSVVLANSVENAVHACEQMSQDKKKAIKIRCSLMKSQILLSVSNTYTNLIQYDKDNNIPTSLIEGHGYGSRSIAAFVKKYGAQLMYETKEGIFELRMVVNV